MIMINENNGSVTYLQNFPFSLCDLKRVDLPVSQYEDIYSKAKRAVAGARI